MREVLLPLGPDGGSWLAGRAANGDAGGGAGAEPSAADGSPFIASDLDENDPEGLSGSSLQRGHTEKRPSHRNRCVFRLQPASQHQRF